MFNFGVWQNNRIAMVVVNFTAVQDLQLFDDIFVVY